MALIDLDVDRGEGVIDAYGWPPDILDEDILSKLLALNLERAGEQMPTYITFEAKALTVKTPLSKGKKDKS